MTAREINRTIRDARGRYVFLWPAPGAGGDKTRIIRARSRAGVLQVQSLATGRWMAVGQGRIVTE